MSRTSRRILVFPVLLLVAGASMAADAKAGAGKFVVKPASDLQFVPLPEGPPGVTQATLWGDSTKGAYAGISKFPAGWSAPLHTHPSDHKIVVISGAWIHGEPGKPDVKLPAGSYLVQPAGQKHTSACDKASECVVFIESSGKFGINMVEEKKASAKK
jgi:quercetin dioxygenase-like cupin family protein